MPNLTRYAVATLGLLVLGLGTAPIVLAQDKPAMPPASREGAMSGDHMMDESMMKMMGRMNKMMDQCEKMMERRSGPAERPDSAPRR